VGVIGGDAGQPASGPAGRGRRGRAVLAAAAVLAALAGSGCVNCLALCVGQFEVVFDPPIREEGRWTFQVSGAEAGEDWPPCTVELPGGETDCAASGSFAGRLEVAIRDGEIFALRLPDEHPARVRVSIHHDEQPTLALTLEPRYTAHEICNQTCYRASVHVGF
jgi:hypothetical protein